MTTCDGLHYSSKDQESVNLYGVASLLSPPSNSKTNVVQDISPEIDFHEGYEG